MQAIKTLINTCLLTTLIQDRRYVKKKVFSVNMLVFLWAVIKNQGHQID